MARSTWLAHRNVVQARVLSLAADGVATKEVARPCGTSAKSVRARRRRFGWPRCGRCRHRCWPGRARWACDAGDLVLGGGPFWRNQR